MFFIFGQLLMLGMLVYAVSDKSSGTEISAMQHIDKIVKLHNLLKHRRTPISGTQMSECGSKLM